MSFEIFAQQVYARFNALSKHELFVVGNDNRIPEQVYIAAFPENTNPVYKTNTEHHCTCCFQFLRNIGNVVAIIDGKIATVWDGFVAPAPYDTVAAKMHEWVLSQPITNLFRTSESSFGKQETFQKLEDSVKKWNHFHADVAARHKVPNPDTVTGEWRSMVEVFKRGLETLSRSALTDVIDLASQKPEQGGLYRGAEFLPTLNSFRDAQDAYNALPEQAREVFLWAFGGSHLARFRNTMIGTLAQDLSEGMDIETAVKAYEKKAAPENYKRPTAIVTPAMIAAAMKTINELGLEPTLARRYAKLSDVSVNNVLWVDNDAKSIMKSPLENLLMSAVGKPVKEVLAEDISIDTFMADVLPTASSISLLVRNSYRNNFVSLTAPVHADAERLFKWDNSFAWSYDGNVADSIKERVKTAGGNVTNAALRVSLAWFNNDDLDLHCNFYGTHVYFANPMGILDVDMNGRGGISKDRKPVENMSFRSLRDGVYDFKVNQYNRRETIDKGFEVEVECAGQLHNFQFNHAVSGDVALFSITIKNGAITDIAVTDKRLVSGSTSQEKWGINTEQFVKVDTLMNSPNYWDNNATGNKHYIFALKGCKQPGKTRGIYNEFLRSDLEQHRKAFELVGNLTQCEASEDQISGLGFSSTRDDNVTVQVKSGNRTRNFNVQF